MIIKDNFCQFCVRTKCCDPSSEPSQRDGSDEGSQHMVSIRNKKNYPSIITKYSPIQSSASTIIYLQGQCRGRSCLGTVQARSGSVQGNSQFIRSWVHCGRIHILYGHQGDILSKESSLYWAAEPCKILIQFALIVGMV